MRYLCIDTSNGASVSIVDFDGQSMQVLSDKKMDNPRMHGEKLAVLLSEVLLELGADNIAEANIDRVVCGTGPAPFTGLRAGLVTARVAAFTAGVPLLGICSLDVLALQGFDFAIEHELFGLDETAKGKPAVFVATDARRKEIYSGLYIANGENDVKAFDDVSVDLPESVSSRFDKYGELDIVNVGQGAYKYSGHFALNELAPLYVESKNMARIAYLREINGIDMTSSEPMYLRRPDVQEPNK
ncbi:tRNA (adenosine(37)-N6)-threonylcarbamoyltransferase complex dimerization subunit type 1 TsaB [Actinomyces sp. zg-332]|uniref:tRNA (adenosine(37)-N6)-threonylcarbamoyltransferase complex dimerization subunit type 1 TsaB n=1 Tax=Actinomyces sp. zg-332 TaxID=2708340 RepID=UPI0014206036|nr:tRNA (adenosine(37)-N6)-threonylcarbamoyltransferase complex dimerization subunit type 1 TsaB [Actinomyces sp. zg-332]QPK94374.1 tRNA (adenosine(37)-N6)-threonylcarbamoyltransferase complex dimerization subunit type 1 TsaB [Actinomyces sp. zg-332]